MWFVSCVFLRCFDRVLCVAQIVIIDFLIVNLDRNLGNIMYTGEDARVYPIDHCAGFPDVLCLTAAQLR